MRNNDQRKAFIRNDESWKVIDLGHYTVTKLLRYKGDEWLRVQVIVEREQWWDRNTGEFSKKTVKELDDKGLFTVNADGDALCYTNETEIINRMKELDKLYPDNAGHPAIPSTVDLPRKGSGPWTV